MRRRRITNDPLRYKDAIIYELPVKSFYDRNADGIGDFQGLHEKLDYLEEVGVTCLCRRGEAAEEADQWPRTSVMLTARRPNLSYRPRRINRPLDRIALALRSSRQRATPQPAAAPAERPALAYPRHSCHTLATFAVGTPLASTVTCTVECATKLGAAPTAFSM